MIRNVSNVFLLCVLLFVNVCFSQTKKDSIVYGDNTIEWRVIEAGEPVLAFAKSGNILWYSTATQAVKYDMRTNSKTAYSKLGTTDAVGIKSIAHDDGIFWFGNQSGVLMNKKDQFTLYSKENGLSDNLVNVVYSFQNQVWVGTNKGINLYQNGAWKSITTAQGLAGDVVNAIINDSKGNVWIGTTQGITVYSNGSMKKYDASSGLSSGMVNALGYDARKNEIWAAVGEQDMNSFDGKKWNTYLDIFPQVVCIMGDTQSRIWFGSKEGIVKFNGFEWLTEPGKVGFPAAMVNCMFKDVNGDLFFAIEKGILHMKNPYPF